MSEYQYYEFRAIDRPLSSADQKYLRSISSRAEITSVSMVNEYHFGDFKGDPLKLMHRCFDLHYYYANWGSRTLMFRLPREALEGINTKPYVGHLLGVHPQADHVVVDLSIAQDDYTELWDDYDPPSADELLPIRDLLMAGDLRPLYLTWLAGSDMLDEGEVEPPVPPGLGDLPPALNALVKFFGVNRELLAVAATMSPALAKANQATANAELAQWVAALPTAEKDAALVQIIEGDAADVRMSLASRFRRDCVAKGKPALQMVDAGRTVGELWQGARAVEGERKRIEAEKRREVKAIKAKANAAKRRKDLEQLAGRYDEAWKEIDAQVQLGATQYGDVSKRLLDLREAAGVAGRTADFIERMVMLTEKYAKRPALMERIRKAGLLAKRAAGA